jgi:hypothetical protein
MMYITYRDGTGPVEARIEKAVRLFYADRRVLPAAIVVNPNELDGAREAIKVLALRTPVKSVGGCLVPEVWLEVAEC